MRLGEATRETKEAKVSARVNLDGKGEAKVFTGVAYLDHMINILAAHSLIDIELEAKGDLIHHVGEDVAITLGEAIRNALGERRGIYRFGHTAVPLEDSLASASVDLAARPYCYSKLKVSKASIEDMATEDIYHFVRSLASSIQATIHVKVVRGENDHHKVEAAFKALALALRQAIAYDVRREGVPSTKGVM